VRRASVDSGDRKMPQVKDSHRDLCSCRVAGQRMGFGQWSAFLEFTGLLKSSTGMTLFYQKLHFRRSQMAVIDDGTSSQTRVLALVDFMEGVVRVAEHMTPPTAEMLAVYLGMDSGDNLGDTSMWKYYSMVNDETAEDMRSNPDAKNQPTHVKLQQLLFVIIYELKRKFSCDSLEYLMDYIEEAREPKPDVNPTAL